jgi:hypothetical protein
MPVSERKAVPARSNLKRWLMSTRLVFSRYHKLAESRIIKLWMDAEPLECSRGMRRVEAFRSRRSSGKTRGRGPQLAQTKAFQKLASQAVSVSAIDEYSW